MQIEENKIFLFKFNTDSGELAIPVRAQSQQQAAASLQNMLGRMLAEVTAEFPRTTPAHEAGVQSVPGLSAAIPSEVLEMRLDTLLKDLGAGSLTADAKAQTVKNWTGLKYEEANFPGIITELELIKTGQKQIPPPTKKNAKS